MKHKNSILKLSVVAMVSIVLVVILFLTSETQVHQNNAFTRRYPHHPISKLYDLDLKYNSYYIAGYHENHLYLGNTTAPLHMLKINLQSKDTAHIKININERDLPFKAVKVQLFAPYFFVMDGTVPVIFRGLIHDWQAKVWMKDKVYFMNALPLDTTKLFIRAISSKTNETILGTVEKTDGFEVKLFSNLLKKQIDGVFDVDGKMAIPQNGGSAIYVYYYRNQFLVMDADLNLVQKEETIDTVSVAQLQLASNKNDQVKMTAPPLQVNISAASIHDNVLIHSKRLGKYERIEMLKQAAIIDVYNWRKRSYEFSFYFYNVQSENVREFNVYDDYMIGLVGNWLSVYRTKPTHFHSTTE